MIKDEEEEENGKIEPEVQILGSNPKNAEVNCEPSKAASNEALDSPAQQLL